MGKRVVLGLSGGVDSAVAAQLLSEQGFDVTGVFLDIGAGGAEDAAAVADSLGISFDTVSTAREMEENVYAPFAAEYLAGRTPLPCARCNRLVKFPALLAYAEKIGADKVATGHYARTENGKLYKGQSPNDQSYLLSRMTREQLRHILFPLGTFDKTAVRALARKQNLPVAEKSASMELCFVPDNDYAAWLEARGDAGFPGNFVDKDNRVLGRHQGIHHYTLGQRRGLGVSGGRRLYVTAIDPASNTVTLSDGSDLGRTEVLCEDINWLTEPLSGPFPCQVRLRHTQRSDQAVASLQPDGQLLIRGEAPFRAPTPGQLAVLYDGDQVLASAWIL